MAPRRVADYAFREFRVVIAEADGRHVGIGYGPKGEVVAQTEGETLEDAEVELRGELLKHSGDFVGIDQAKKVFRKAFPDGFKDAFLEFDERRYKMAAHQKAAQLLAKERLDALLLANDHGEVIASAKRTFTNLIFPNEAMKFGDFAKSTKAPHVAFAEALRELLWGAEFDRAFDEIADMLRPYGAAKWTTLTYWPFMTHPETHIFMKPEVAMECAWRLADDFGYESDPQAAIYRRFQAFAERLRDGIADLEPRDFIDVQTFMYVVGKPGFIVGAEQARANWIASRTSGPV
jgi:hypothetical protein